MARASRSTALALTLAAAALATTGCGLLAPHEGAIEHTLMVNPDHPAGGTGAVDRERLLVAYYASQAFHDRLNRLRAQRDAAEPGPAAEIETRGGELQELAHHQLAGTEPVYTVLIDIQGELDRVLDERGLWRAVLVTGPSDHPDITADLVGRITPRRAPDAPADGG
ncbi:MAG: hypothetical protein ACTS22_08060 [Phycisphaerales bacterium]